VHYNRGHSAGPWRHYKPTSHDISSLCRTAYCFLRQLRQVVRSVSVDAAKTAVQAFISSRLDYCNSLLYNISDILLRRLQAIQNVAARLVTGTRRCDHITPILQRLLVQQRVEFKLAVLVYKALNDMAPPYLSDDCQLVATTTGRRQLRSPDNFKCTVNSTSSRLGDRAFAAAGPRLRNSLPRPST